MRDYWNAVERLETAMRSAQSDAWAQIAAISAGELQGIVAALKSHVVVPIETLKAHCYCADNVDEERDATGSHDTFTPCDWCKARTNTLGTLGETAEQTKAEKP